MMMDIKSTEEKTAEGENEGGCEQKDGQQQQHSSTQQHIHQFKQRRRQSTHDGMDKVDDDERERKLSSSTSPSRDARFQWFKKQPTYKRSFSNSDVQMHAPEPEPPVNSPNSSSQIVSQKGTFRGLRARLGTVMDKLLRDSAKGMDFLAHLKGIAAKEIVDRMKNFIQDFEANLVDAPLNRKRDTVHAFYEELEYFVHESPLFYDLGDEELDAVLLGAEKHVMKHIYNLVFSRNSDEGARDAALHSRIRQLQWIRPHHLDAVIDLSDKKVVIEVKAAIDYLVLMDAKQAPFEKLQCVLSCANKIFDIIQKSASSTQVASADDFLPALIYILIQANPPHIHSNINYLDSFCNPKRLSAGEAGYHYTSLVGAAQFVETINAKQLNLTQEAFDRLMDGEASNVTEGLESISLMKDVLDRLRALETKQNVLQKEIEILIQTRQELCSSAIKPAQLGPDAELTEYTAKALDSNTRDGNFLRKKMTSQTSPFSKRRQLGSQ
eukprot:m.40977 g.40977  ORF g.40977 m.40977 type:complete len:495 (+) comp6968_c0_seq1:93-1577(+)